MSNNPIFQQFLTQQLEENPRLQAMLSIMQQNQANVVENTEPESSPATYYNDLQEQLKRAEAKIKQLRATVANLKAELNGIEAFDEDIAHALGACIDCWGEDPGCRSCRGKGKPGYFDPDEKLYDQWILPAVERIEYSRKRRVAQ